jgi:hypothetical protein
MKAKFAELKPNFDHIFLKSSYPTILSIQLSEPYLSPTVFVHQLFGGIVPLEGIFA